MVSPTGSTAGGAALVHPVTGAGLREGSVSERSNKHWSSKKKIEADYEKSHPGTAALAAKRSAAPRSLVAPA